MNQTQNVLFSGNHGNYSLEGTCIYSCDGLGCWRCGFWSQTPCLHVNNRCYSLTMTVAVDLNTSCLFRACESLWHGNLCLEQTSNTGPVLLDLVLVQSTLDYALEDSSFHLYRRQSQLEEQQGCQICHLSDLWMISVSNGHSSTCFRESCLPYARVHCPFVQKCPPFGQHYYPFSRVSCPFSLVCSPSYVHVHNLYESLNYVPIYCPWMDSRGKPPHLSPHLQQVDDLLPLQQRSADWPLP